MHKQTLKSEMVYKTLGIIFAFEYLHTDDALGGNCVSIPGGELIVIFNPGTSYGEKPAHVKHVPTEFLWNVQRLYVWNIDVVKLLKII